MAVSRCLPTKSQFHFKHVAIDLYYPSCNVVVESIYYSLVSCSFAQEVWGILLLDVNVGDFEVFDVWFEAILKRFDHPRVEKIATVDWALWGARNNLVWNKIGVTAAALVTSALLCLEQWTNAQDINFDDSMESLLPGDRSEHWVKPHENTLKVNLDAALFTDHMRFSYILVARGADDRLVVAKVVCKPGQFQPEVVEAFGMKDALSWVQGRQEQNFVIETDCLSVIQALRSSIHMSSYFRVVIQDCKILLSHLHNILLCFMKHSANRGAPYLARASYVTSKLMFRESNALSEYSDVLLKDFFLMKIIFSLRRNITNIFH
ncbi:uncharacterized protein LOC133796310 [Humulus lupulus]|uniref:uncharacterized protein LOC133796310 n=1 Tax=Humulus lupulus TaxID=3486 RepID=UPI002B40EAF7|nr:uncharacterized protein LOC133796310 [Humulus lupulus]